MKNGLLKVNSKTKKETLSAPSDLNKFYKNIELYNIKFQSFAFPTHPDAYNSGEMSKLPAHDPIRILLTPDMKEWMGAETWEQAWTMAKNMNTKCNKIFLGATKKRYKRSLRKKQK